MSDNDQVFFSVLKHRISWLKDKERFSFEFFYDEDKLENLNSDNSGACLRRSRAVDEKLPKPQLGEKKGYFNEALQSGWDSKTDGLFAAVVVESK